MSGMESWINHFVETKRRSIKGNAKMAFPVNAIHICKHSGIVVTSESEKP